jgi:hypothetical protein
MREMHAPWFSYRMLPYLWETVNAGKFRGFQTRLGQSFEEVLEQCQPCFFFENGEPIAWGSIRFRVLKSAESFSWIAASISSGNISA